MEEKAISRKQKPKEKKEDGLFSVSVCQTVLSVVLVLVVLFLSKGTGQTSNNLREDFSLLMSVSFEKKDVENVVAGIKEYFSSPAELSVFKLFKKTEEQSETSKETASSSETTTESDEPTTEEKENSEETTTAPESTTAPEETTKKAKAVSATPKNGSGGADLESYKAQDGTTFSPVETTAPIVTPVSGTYTSYFGYRVSPITGNDSFHTGLDIAAAEGTKIKAAYPGKVRKVGEDSRSGKYLYLTHEDGFETLYCHCSEIIAEEGAVIRQGETVALVGSTGWSTGPHLHFEIHKNGTRLDPLTVLKKQ